MKKATKIILAFFLFVIIALVSIVVLFTVLEYKPADVEPMEITGSGSETLRAGDTIDVISWNVGFAALDKDHDFFLNGGTVGFPKTEDEVHANLQAMISRLEEEDCDIIFLQEVDSKATRTFKINQADVFAEGLGGASTFAKNYDAFFVPLPISSPMAQITSGIQTVTNFNTENAERISLPDAHGWPMSTCQLKRCLLKQEIPLEGTDKKLVLFNLHLEAFAEGEKKAAQTNQLHELALAEYEKGNYVIAGGDFNQSMPGVDLDLYPILSEGAFVAHPIDESTKPEGFSYISDPDVPSNRFASSPYNGDWETTQLYIIDGYLVSPNVQVNSVHCLNEEFEYSDHNPIKMNITLLNE